MKDKNWWESQLEYGHELLHSAVAGAREAVAEEPISDVLVRSVRASLPWAAFGAGVALLVLSTKDRKTIRTRALFALFGALVGFGTNVALSTRELTSEVVDGAMHNLHSVRDAHWLSEHPIDFA